MTTIHVDSAGAAAAATVGGALLAGVLVFTSVLELAQAQQPDRYSLRKVESAAHADTLSRLAEATALVSGASSVLGLVATAVDCQIIRIIAVSSAVLDALLFASVAVMAVRWFWRPSARDPDPPDASDVG
jgi:hypothetical protein